MQQFTSSITSKGQVTIPKNVRDLLGVSSPDKISFIIEKDLVKIMPATSVVEATAGILKSKMKSLSPRQEKKAAESAIAQEVIRRSNNKGQKK